MLALKELTAEEFHEYREFTLKNYAQSLATHFKRPLSEARGRAERQIQKLLKDGLQTKGHFLYAIIDKSTCRTVGHLWFAVNEAEKVAFLYDIFIDEPHRGKGFGREALTLFEDRARKLGMRFLMLNVIGTNEIAIKLYTSQGFYTTNCTMQKDL
jgi:ribosomal protein S18 acetylase RimI-like enzyme